MIGDMFINVASVGALYGVGGVGENGAWAVLPDSLEGALGLGAAPTCNRDGVGSGVLDPGASSRRTGFSKK